MRSSCQPVLHASPRRFSDLAGGACLPVGRTVALKDKQVPKQAFLCWKAESQLASERCIVAGVAAHVKEAVQSSLP